MYRILDSNGNTIAIVSRRQDALALAQKTANEPKKTVDKLK